MKIRKIVFGAGMLSLALLALSLPSKGWMEWKVSPQFEAARGRMENNLLQYRSGGHILGFSAEGVLIASGTHALKMEFVGAGRVQPVCPGGSERGDSETIGASGGEVAPPLTEVSYPGLWSGITLKYEGKNGSVLKSTFEVLPGAEPQSIRLKSSVPIEIDNEGLLHYRFEMGEMMESKPVAWQEIDGRRVAVGVNYRKIGDREIGFRTDAYDRSKSLSIDPVLTWITFIGGGESSEENATSIVVGGGGNIFVSGYCTGMWGNAVRPYGGGASDAFVAKLNPGGTLLWNTLLGGNEKDKGMAVAVDASGNVFVAGISAGTWGSPIIAHTGFFNAFAAKLNSNGELQWNTFLGRTYEYASNGIAVDASGDVYVAGESIQTWGSPIRSYFGDYSIDGFAAKLNSSGALQWNTFIGGSGSDKAAGISIDGSGNVYLTGSSDATWENPLRPFENGGKNAFAAKLNSSGGLQWNTFVGGSGDFAGWGINADGSGNVYLTGKSPNGAFATKLNTSGGLQWNTILGNDVNVQGTGIAVDRSGNVYVTGCTTSTWGTPIRPYSGFLDAFAAKLNSSGKLQWNTFLGESSQDESCGVAVDGSGNVFIAGFGCGTWGNPIRPFGGGSQDAFAVKLNSSGGLVWNTFLGGVGGGEGVIGNEIAVDGSGNVYVTGISYGTWGRPIRPFGGGSQDAFAAKLNLSGTLQWNTFLGGAGGDNGRGISVDRSGNVYLSGESNATWGVPIRPFGGGYYDAFAAKLNSNGGLEWHTFLGGNAYEVGLGISVDGSGNVYVTGVGSGTWGSPIRPFEGGIFNAFAVKLNASGGLVWNTFLGGGEGHDGVKGSEISVDASGNIFITGYCDGTWGNPVRPYGGGYDAYAAKLNSSGALQWNTFLGGSGYDIGCAVSVDGLGNVYVAGYSRFQSWGSPVRPFVGGEYNSADAFAAKLNSGGALQWNTFLGGDGVDEGLGVAVDGLGNVYVTGTSGLTWGSPIRPYGGGSPDAFGAQVDSNGALQWNTFLGGTGLDYGNGIAVDGLGSAYFVGTSSAGWGNPIQPSAGNTAAFVAVVSSPDLLALALTSPNGGENWCAGSIHHISWGSMGTIANVRIEYSTNNGSAWTTLAASTANTGAYAWTIPDVISSSCLVRVSEAATGIPSDVSHSAFAITDAPPMISLSKTSLSFGTERNGTPTPAESSVISNSGTGTLNWTATPSADWLSVSPGSGAGGGVLTIRINRTDLQPGNYTGTITVSDPNAANSPRTINVRLSVLAKGTDSPPFGAFDKPGEGSTVASSIPVTGWGLDDIGVQSVKIYRGTGFSDRVYIGDANFVRGARPDVESANPTYPQNDRAGWGYMLLTNFLPNGGNGPFQILAYAIDTGGHEVLLGSKTVTCDNLNAIKPFGAIDTPSQGGMVFGSSYVNFGWALTPQPKSISIDGSTITVWVDGLALGHPVYSNYRKDIAELFSGYANSNGAVGYFNLNTTGYADGVHTIAWSVVDSGGAVDGIGSRYFMIENAAGSANLEDGRVASAAFSSGRQQTGIRPAAEIAQIPEDGRALVYIRRGFEKNLRSEMVVPEADGSLRIRIAEVSRVALYLNEMEIRENEAMGEARVRRMLLESAEAGGASPYGAYELVLDELRPLPVGASFDSRAGVFYWQPGPGFAGEYTIVFVKKDKTGGVKKTVKIEVGSPTTSIR